MKTAIFTKVFNDRSLTEAIELAADIGFDGIELMGRSPHVDPDLSPEEAERRREQIDDLGLEVAGIASYTGKYLDRDSSGCQETLEDLEHHLELADIFGTDLVRHGPGGPPEREATSEDYEDAAQWMRKAADLAEAHSKQLGVEIHADTIIESAPTAASFVDRIDRENVGVIHDAGNMYVAGEDYAANAISTLDNRVSHVHVKDIRRMASSDAAGIFTRETKRGAESFQFRVLGAGDVDHWSVVAALHEIGYTGFLTTECHRPTDDTWSDKRIAEHELSELHRLIETVKNP